MKYFFSTNVNMTRGSETTAVSEIDAVISCPGFL